MFRVALSRAGVSLIASLSLLGGAAETLNAQPESAPTADSAPPSTPPAAPPSTPPAAPPKAQPASDPYPAAPKFDAQLTSVLRGKGGSITLVGRSGQQYEPAGDLAWQRIGSGGVSVSVTRMFRGGNGKLYAAGNRAPLFAQEDGLWSGYSLARKGPSAASSGSAPIIAMRRQLYELGATGWRALAITPAVVKHLWAASATRVFFADVDGQLWSGRGAGWQRIAITLAPGESIAEVHGLAGKLAVALTSKGRVFSLNKRTARLVSTGSLGSELHVEALGVVGGRLLAAAQYPDKPPSAEAKTVLLEVGQDALTQIEELWPLAAGDRFSILTEHAGELLVATSKGQVRTKLADDRWKNVSLSEKPLDPALRFPRSGPARAR